MGFGKIVQGEWEGLVEKGTEGEALGILTSMGMKQPQTSRERRSARIEKTDRVKHDHLSFVNSESGDGSQVEGFEEMRNKERNSK